MGSDESASVMPNDEDTLERYKNQFLGGEDSSVVQKRLHSNVYHSERARRASMGIPDDKCKEKARSEAQRVVALWHQFLNEVHAVQERQGHSPICSSMPIMDTNLAATAHELTVSGEQRAMIIDSDANDGGPDDIMKEAMRVPARKLSIVGAPQQARPVPMMPFARGAGF